jgi:hypothetical protein
MSKFFTTTVDDSGDVHGQVTLVTGNAGLPFIAYTTQSGEVRLAEQESNGEWIITTPPCGTAMRDEYRISLDLDGNEPPQPHIALVNASTDRLIYGALRDHQWEFEEVPTEGGLFPGRVRFPSMKLYKGFREVFPEFKDAPHICYQAAQGIIELRHAAKLQPRDSVEARPVPGASPVWRKHVETIAGGDFDQGWFATMNISVNDTLRIAHFNDRGRITGQAERRLRVMTMLQNEAFIDRPDPVEGWLFDDFDEVDQRDIIGARPALAQNINGEAAVSYIAQRTQTLNLAIFGNRFSPEPQLEVVATNVNNEEIRSSVVQDLHFNWCVVYGFEGRLKFATRTEARSYAIEDVDVGGGWPSMALDNDGNTQIAHVAGGSLQFTVKPREDD